MMFELHDDGLALVVEALYAIIIALCVDFIDASQDFYVGVKSEQG